MTESPASGGEPKAGFDVATLQRIAAVGVAARLVLWAISAGADIVRWTQVAAAVSETGVLHLSDRLPAFLLSPLVALWAGVAFDLAAGLEAPFELVFKLLPLAADLATMWLVFRVARGRAGQLVDGWRAVAVLALSLASIWVSCHHGGLDSVLVFFALAAVVFVDEGDRPILAGAALACAMHIHPGAVVLLPALAILQGKSLRHAAQFIAAWLVVLAPLALPLSIHGFELFAGELTLDPAGNRFGVDFWLDHGSELPVFGSFIADFASAYFTWSWKLMLLASAALGFWGYTGARSSLEVGALVVVVMLLVTPHLELPFAAIPVAFLALLDLRRALLYAVVSGAFLTVAYLSCTPSEVPLASKLATPIGFPIELLGLACWLLLVEFMLSQLGLRRAFVSTTPPGRFALPTITVVIAAPFGLAFALATPPFQVADEPLHAFIGCAVAHGQLAPGKDAPPPFRSTLAVPESLVKLHKKFDALKIRFNPRIKVSAAAIDEAARMQGSSQYVTVSVKAETGEIAVYPPAMYVPQAIACGIGQAYRYRPLQLLAVMRLANLASFLLIAFVALTLLPTGREAAALVLLSPMALSAAASASGDGQLIPMVVLWIALLLHISTAPGDAPPLRPLYVVGLAMIAFMISLAKSVYLPLALAVALIPGRRFGSRRAHVVALLFVVGVSIVGALLWIPQNGEALAANAAAKGLDPMATWDARLEKPFTFLLTAFRTFFRGRIVNGVVGTLGWLDTALPFRSVALFWAALLPLTLWGAGSVRSTRRGAALLVLGVGSAAGLALFYALYFNAADVDHVAGVQGRHAIPSLIVIAVAIAEFLGVAPGPRARRLGSAVVGVTAVVILVSALGAIEARYYADRRDVPGAMAAPFRHR